MKTQSTRVVTYADGAGQPEAGHKALAPQKGAAYTF